MVHRHLVCLLTLVALFDVVANAANAVSQDYVQTWWLSSVCSLVSVAADVGDVSNGVSRMFALWFQVRQILTWRGLVYVRSPDRLWSQRG